MVNQIQELINESKIKYSFIYKNLVSGEIFSFRPDQLVSSASTIKLFIMAKAFQQVKEGKLDLNRTFIITEEDRIENTLECGARFNLKELITLMITKSDNIATNLLIDAVGIQSINLFIKELGIPNTILQRKMLDFEARKAGKDNFTTASDLVSFLELLYLGKVINEKYSKIMLDIMKQNRPWWNHSLPEDITVAHKDGNLEGIKHDSGIGFTSKGEYIFTVLTWDCKDEKYQKEVFTGVLKYLYDWFMN